MLFRRIFLLASLIMPLMLAGQSLLPKNQHISLSTAESSVLATGKWFKMKIYKDDIYCLTYDDIRNMGFTNPADVKIFGNGGDMIPLMNNVPRYDDLNENAIYMNSGSDGIFNQGDYILFYGKGPVTWHYNMISGMFEHQVHLYSDASYYFVTTDAGTGKRITDRELLSGTPSSDIYSFDDYSYHERNRYNLLESGRYWYGDRIDLNTFDTTFIFPHRITAEGIKLKTNTVSRSAYLKTVGFFNSNNLIGTTSIQPVILTNTIGVYANQKTSYFNFSSASEDVNIQVTYNRTSSSDEAYIDYLTLNVRRSLTLDEDLLFFRDHEYAGTESIATYHIENCNSVTQIWDITDPINIRKVPALLSGTTLSFTDSTKYLRDYAAVNPGNGFSKPIINTNEEHVGLIENQNLHHASPHQMLIVTHPLFIQAADSIAQFHRNHDNLSVLVATTDQIYNEFSSGAPDVSAVRDFARLIYNKATGEGNRLKYLLLLGDGSYNNISENGGNVNFILTYQSENSLNTSDSYVSDDFYGFMEPAEGGHENMENFSLDLGVGRLPVKTAEEALTVYRKIKMYNTSANKGDWQNNILFAADDGDGNLHMTQANDLANWVETQYPQFAIRKVLADAYLQVSSSKGARYPEAKNAIVQNIEKGLLIFNYTGHGGELGLADEQLLMREDLQALTNSTHLPLFITATCEFSRFDDLTKDEHGNLTESTSAGEYSLLNPNGGSIALFTTTRIVYSSENHELNTRFYEIAFTRDPDGNFHALGDLIKMTKNLESTRNKLNFILLGDPALKLAIPNYNVVTDSINFKPVIEPLDTLKAFSRITVTGHVEDADHNIPDNFNGYVYPSVFDKKKTITTLANDYNSAPMQFTTRENILYKGKASVRNGKFTFTFIVPKDITYSFGYGKMMYFSNNGNRDANGQISSFIIGGTDKLHEIDTEGPEIALSLNDDLFNNQGITDPNPVIYARISDESGINTIGNGIGHDIIGIIDGNVTHPVIMNEYFQSNLDDFTTGTLTYPMWGLSEGIHSLSIKVWDVLNNSAEADLQFRVIEGSGISVSRVINFPNPAEDHTTFIFEHNKAGEELSVILSVFDMTGRLIYEVRSNIVTTGYNTKLSEWDLTDMNGNKIRQGVYPYRIRVSKNGSTTDAYQKIIILRY